MLYSVILMTLFALLFIQSASISISKFSDKSDASCLSASFASAAAALGAVAASPTLGRWADDEHWAFAE